MADNWGTTRIERFDVKRILRAKWKNILGQNKSNGKWFHLRLGWFCLFVARSADDVVVASVVEFRCCLLKNFFGNRWRYPSGFTWLYSKMSGMWSLDMKWKLSITRALMHKNGAWSVLEKKKRTKCWKRQDEFWCVDFPSAQSLLHEFCSGK